MEDVFALHGRQASGQASLGLALPFEYVSIGTLEHFLKWYPRSVTWNTAFYLVKPLLRGHRKHSQPEFVADSRSTGRSGTVTTQKSSQFTLPPAVVVPS